MANIQNLQPGNVNHTFTPEETLKGVQNSIATRKKNAIIKNSLQKILNMGIKVPQIDPNKPMDKDIKELLEKLQATGVDTKNLDLVDLMNFGQMLGAIFGKAECYKALLETNNENQQEVINKEPHITSIEEIVDNSHLDKDLYEANKH